MKILAIRFARLGDVVLLLPALSQLKQSYPGSHLTFLTGHRCASIAELCPAIDAVISLDRVALRDGPVVTAFIDMGRLIREIRRRRFDLVVDFHSFRETNLLTWLSRARQRAGLKRYDAPYLSFCFNLPPVLEDKSIHVGKMFQRIAAGVTGNVEPVVSKTLVIPDNLEQWARQAVTGGARLTMYIDAPVPERIWPAEYFAKAADFAIDNLGARVVVISGKEGRHLVERLQAASRHEKELAVFSDITVPQLAALIASSRLLISNDTGPMHLGPAVGVPTLALFSVGYPEHFSPTGPGDRFLRRNPIGRIEVDEVIEAMQQMWVTAVDRDSRR